MLMLTLFGCAKDGEDDKLTPEEYNNMIAGNVDDEPVDNAALTIIFCKSAGTVNPFETVISEFEELYQVEVNFISYPEAKWDNLLTKLMAQDTDFDLFVPTVGDIADSVRTGAYEDLSQYDSLSSRVTSNELVNMLSNINGTVIGVPYRVSFSNTAEYTTANTYFKYFHKNLNLFTNEYKDTDGEELFYVLKHLYSNPEDTLDAPYYDFDYYQADVSYLFMNKHSQKKDMAEKFLCMVYDYANKDLIHPEYYVPTYPEYESGIEYIPSWLHWEYEIAKPIAEARSKVLETDGSDEAIRKLAQDAAKGLRMRLEG